MEPRQCSVATRSPLADGLRYEERRPQAVSANFPEAEFPPAVESAIAYRKAVDVGRQRMRQARVVICGLARDIGSILPKTMARIERLGRLFADYRVVVYENDSRDNTRAQLESWESSNPRVNVLKEDRGDVVNQQVRCLQRATRMAYYRNRYREYVARHYSGFDVVIVVDTDLEVGWSYQGVAHSFAESDWDCIGAYGIIYKRIRSDPNVPVHFDAWAFRPDGFQPLTTKEVNAMKWQRGAALVPVYSCFGGMGIYRTQALVQCEYGGEDNEHVCLHREMRRRGWGRVFLNPNLITLYGRKRRKLDPLIYYCRRAADWIINRPSITWRCADPG
jgi:hypothetical protein